MTVDVGTGDGRAVLGAAARDPRTLHIGLDPVAAAMAEASRRAARPGPKGGLPNALFVVAAAESPPDELLGLAAHVTVRLPWASLLGGCLGADPPVARGLASLLARGGALELLLAPDGRDRLAGLPTEPADVVAAATVAFKSAGLACASAREATAAEIRASGSTWAKRLLGGVDRGAAAGAGRRVVVARFRSP